MLAFLLLSVGCKKETTAIDSNSDANKVAITKETNFQRVTTVDGNITQISSTVEKKDSREITLISKPANWNGDLILYAHGYVSPFLPLALPIEASGYVPLFTSLGYAFATTSYRENGLAIQSGIDDIMNLRKSFIKAYGEPRHIYLTGGSEGGIVTALAIEREPKLFNGGLPLCGPCGDFQRQLNYYGDFRVLFDYFFPGVLPGNAIDIPDELIANWQTVYVPKIIQAITLNPVATTKLLSIVLDSRQAPYILSSNTNIGTTVISVLWYDVFATRDAVNKLEGQPFDNTTRVYAGLGTPAENTLLNNSVQRFSADKKALQNVAKYYETTGNITLPVVSAHTIGDPLIPIWHLQLYQEKTVVQGTSSFFRGLPVPVFGHCNFSEADIVAAFGLLVQQVQGQTPTLVHKLVNASRSNNGKIVQSIEKLN
jgi:hypothetical protein